MTKCALEHLGKGMGCKDQGHLSCMSENMQASCTESYEQISVLTEKLPVWRLARKNVFSVKASIGAAERGRSRS